MQAIVAVSENWGIGREGQLLFHISADLKRFRSITAGHTVVMGRKTLLSLPGSKGLPNRRNIVLSRDPDYQPPQGVELARSPEEAAAMAGPDAFCIGGGEIYRQMLPLCSRVYVTRVLAEAEADTFFPDLDTLPGWCRETEGPVLEENGVRFQYVDYVKEEKRDT